MAKLISVLGKMRDSESAIKSATCTITHEMVPAIMEFNTNNRPVSKGKVALYASELLRGKWALNGEPLIFGIDDEGNEQLISGQHRLLALEKANELYNEDPEKYPDAVLEMHTVVIYGVAVDTADTVDQINPRSHGDVLFRDEWVNSQIPEEFKKTNSKRAAWCKALGGAARLVWLRAGGATVSSAPKFLTSEMLEFIKEDHPSLCTFVSEVLTAADGKENTGLRMSLPYVAALSYVASLDAVGNYEAEVNEEKHEKISLFLSQVASGTGYAPGSAAHAITQYWNKLTSEPGSKDRDLEWVAPFVKCLTALVNGTGCKPSDLKLSKKEADNYRNVPSLIPGWDTVMFEYARELETKTAEEREAIRIQKEEERVERKRLAEEKKAEKAAQKEEERLRKEEEKAKKAEEKAAEKEGEVPPPKPASAVGKFLKKKPPVPVKS
jgi:hypothetical protein